MKNKLNFCTLFDSNYLHFGLTLYSSLKRHCDNFHLYIFAFDDKCEKFLKLQNLENVTVISLCEFEDEELLAIKSTRSKGEYCWTCTASTILYVLKKFSQDHCTYVDSDIFFFNNPRILIDEVGDNSVLITPHNYLPQYDQSKVSGKYCVQFMMFKNDECGLEALNWWRKRCIEWCYAEPEDGKFGDQKYLDDWMIRFKKVHELKHEGGVAPWNISSYKIKDGKIYKKNGEVFDLVFYHFHGFCLLSLQVVKLAPAQYLIKNDAIKEIYKKYLQEIYKSIAKIGYESAFLNEVNAKKAGFFKKIAVRLLGKRKNIILR